MGTGWDTLLGAGVSSSAAGGRNVLHQVGEHTGNGVWGERAGGLGLQLRKGAHDDTQHQGMALEGCRLRRHVGRWKRNRTGRSTRSMHNTHTPTIHTAM